MRALVLVFAFVSAFSWSAHAQTFTFGGGPWAPLSLVGQSAGGSVYATGSSGLYSSEDGGLRWALRATGFVPRVVEGAADGTLWAAGGSGVFRSSDDGTTWLQERTETAWDIAIDGQDVVAIIDKRVERRRGGAWTNLNVPIGTSLFTVRPISVAARDGRIAVGVYERSLLSTSGRTVLRDRDTEPWRVVAMQPPTRLSISSDGTVWAATGESYVFIVPTSGNVSRIPPRSNVAQVVHSGTSYDIRVLPSGAVVYTTVGEVRQENPAAILSGNLPVGQLGRIVNTPEGLIIGTQETTACAVNDLCSPNPPSGIYAMREGYVQHVGATPAPVYALAVAPNTTLLAGGTAGLVHRLEGAAWVPEGAPLPLVRGFVNAGTPDDITVYGAAALDVGGMPVPSSWPSMYTRTDSGMVRFGLGGEVGAIARLGADWLVSRPGGGDNTQSGLYWTASTETPLTLTLSRAVAGLRTIAVLGNRVVLAGAWGPVRDVDIPPTVRAWESRDSGRTWTPAGDGLEGRKVYAFVRSGGRTYAGTDRGVYLRGADAPWTASGLQDLAIRTFAVVSDTLLAGTSDGLFRADGADWVRYGAGLDGRTVYAIQPVERPTGRVIAVGTDQGVWVTPSLANVDAEPGAPVADMRVSVGPNPTRGAIVVRPGGDWPAAEVSVFDVIGRRVVGPVEVSPSGEARLDLSRQPAGIYLVRLSADSRVATRTVTVAQ